MIHVSFFGYEPFSLNLNQQSKLWRAAEKIKKDTEIRQYPMMVSRLDVIYK